MKAWHFLRVDAAGRWRTGSGGDGAGVIIEPGQVLRVEGEIVPCHHGLHASVDILDALQYAPGHIITRVDCRGTIVEHGGDKIACSERECLWGVDGEDVLRRFVRLWYAPDVVRRYLRTGDESLRAAARDRQRRRLVAMVHAEHRRQP